MSILKNGTLCVTVGSRGPNNGTLVRVVRFVGASPRSPGINEGYLIETASGQPFKVLLGRERGDTKLAWNTDAVCLADRRNLRPLDDPEDAREEERELVLIEKGGK